MHWAKDKEVQPRSNLLESGARYKLTGGMICNGGSLFFSLIVALPQMFGVSSVLPLRRPKKRLLIVGTQSRSSLERKGKRAVLVLMYLLSYLAGRRKAYRSIVGLLGTVAG